MEKTHKFSQINPPRRNEKILLKFRKEEIEVNDIVLSILTVTHNVSCSLLEKYQKQ